jgi:riboflavin synthase
MFTGIVEAMGKVIRVENRGTNRTYWIRSELGPSLKADQSLSHDGVCLTVEAVDADIHQVTAIEETLLKTNLGGWQAGEKVNLERAMMLGRRLDGHIVQGHVDATGTCISRENQDGSWVYRFRFPARFGPLVIEKGSIAVNGISLTAFDLGPDAFSVAIIPYTFSHTGISQVEPGKTVNLEFDMLGKYILRMTALNAGLQQS